MSIVVILTGSKSDLPFVNRITAALDKFGIACECRVASAHKSAAYLLDMLAQYEASGKVDVYVTVAGRSNALSGMVDANVSAPVIACPPYSEAFGGADVYSSLRMPSGVAPALVLEPEGAALLAAKILGLKDKVRQMQQANVDALLAADRELVKRG
ncbi:MAG: AIR carboxylase family protein [Anaerolineae bacterium]|nr:AIR carboxylase family protein [Anaerolineae bacterium]